jgi:hypothetical protein
VPDQSFFPNKAYRAHVALVNVATKVLFSVMPFQNVSLFERLLTEAAPEVPLENVHRILNNGQLPEFIVLDNL